MNLDYNGIFSCIVDLIKTAMPVACFLYFTDIMMNFFFSLAFPKISRKGD